MAKNRARTLYLTLLAAGCKVGPDYHAPETRTPQRWAELPDLVTSQPASQPASSQPAAITPAAAPASDLARWWRMFSDPRLDALIERAISSNLDLRIVEARIREARAQRAIVAGGLYPTLGSGASYTRQHPSQKGQLGRLNTGITQLFSDKVLGEYELYQAGFDASWELDVFGGVRRGIEAAEAGTQSKIEERRDVLVMLVAEVARSYIDLRGMQRRLEIARENLASQRSTLQLVRQKRSVGAVTELDVTRASAQASLAESHIPVFMRQIRYSIHTLSVLLDEDVDVLSAELSTTAPLPKVPAAMPIGLPAELLARRPDIRRSERELASTLR